ncbi:MAG: endonuclease/exonuclease/phosphatase family protein [Ferruginibacter sp.]
MPVSIVRRLTKKIFILTNLLVALLFLLGCYSELLFSAAWWPMGFLTLSLFYLWVFLVVFFIFWLFIRSRWFIVFIVTAALSFNHVRNIIPFRFQNMFEMKKQAKDLRIMSWNVAQFDIMKFKERPGTYKEMISLVNEFKPDIACFQEMVSGDTLADLNNPYYRKYSFYSVFDFVDKLNLPNYFYSYNYKENFLSQQHFGIIIFSRYPIINKQTISNFPHDYNSIFQYADIVTDTDTVRVFNCHLQSLRFSPTNLNYIRNPTIKNDTDIVKSKNLITKFKNAFIKRRVQADHVRAEINKSPYPVIVCGDFNDVPNSYPYETIRKDLQDAFVKKGAGLGRTFSGISPTLRIDNIFVDRQYLVHQFIRIQKNLSDHFPIITDISHLPD